MYSSPPINRIYQGIYSRQGLFAVIAGILCLSGVLLWLIIEDSGRQYASAERAYRYEIHDESAKVRDRINQSFQEIYSNLRTISRVPSVRNSDIQGKNLSISDIITAQEIYKNLASYVSISEIYIQSENFNPDFIDPVTGNVQEPIMVLDNLIEGHKADDCTNRTALKKQAPPLADLPQDRLYHTMLEQMGLLRQVAPTLSILGNGLNVPAVSSRLVTTCDISFVKQGDTSESERSGLVYSVPFYDKHGDFRGIISAVVLAHSLQALLPNAHYVLVNKSDGQEISLPDLQGVRANAKASIAGAQAEPQDFYSEVFPFSFPETGDRWQLWVGYSDAEFMNGVGRQVLKVRYLACAVVLIFALIVILSFFLARSNHMRERYRLTLALQKAEQERAEESALVSNIVENAADGILTVDDRGEIQSINSAASRIFGYEVYDVLGNDIRMLMPDLHVPTQVGAEAGTEVLANEPKKGLGVGLKINGRRKNGSLFSIDLSLSEVHRGDKILFIIIVRDISEQERKTRLLEESEQRFRLLADSMPSLLWMSDSKGECSFVNQTWLQFTGRTFEQEKGNGWLEPMHPDDLEISLRKFHLAIEQEVPFETWFRMLRHDGSYRWMMNVGVPRRISENQTDGFIGVCSDITEQRQAYEALREERRFVQAIMDAIPDPIFVKDDRAVCRGGNAAFWLLLDGEPEKLIGQKSPELFPAERVGVSWSDDDMALAGIFVEREETIVTRDGKRTVAVSKSALTMPDGMAGLVGIMHDITERKEFEEEIRMRRDNLQEMVAAQTQDLIIQKEKAEQANVAKSEFLANMSHELRTPMHAILNYAKMGLDRLGRENPEKIEKYLRNIGIAGNRLMELLNNLLDLAKMEAGKMTFDFKPSQFNEVIEHATLELESLFKQKNMTCTVNQDMPDCIAIYDRLRLIQVVINILSNAIKFSPVGAAIHITVTDAFLPDGRAALSCAIADEGAGIPESELDVVFDKFIQSSKTKTGSGGTGLGLSICRDIIHAHGGSIWAQNNPDKGASFIFLIPKEHTVA